MDANQVRYARNSVTGGISLIIAGQRFYWDRYLQYTIVDSEDSLESTARLRSSKTGCKYPNWRFSETVGYYNLTTTNWIYHTDLGWLYLEKRGGLETTTWIWSDKVGWFWTGEAHAPNAYLSDLSGWFAFTVRELDGVNPKRYMTWPIYDQTKKIWMTEADLRIARVNTILAEFESLDKVIVLSWTLRCSLRPKMPSNRTLVLGSLQTMESMGFTFGN